MGEEYVDFFPDEVLVLSPSREVHFEDPYRMVPTEVAKTKKQIEDLLEKKFIRSSVSSSEALILLLKKKDNSSRLCIDYHQLNKLTIKNKLMIYWTS